MKERTAMAFVGYAAAQLASEFAENGYVVLPDFLAPPESAAMNAELEAHYAPLLKEARERISALATAFECDVITWDPCADGNALFVALRDDSRLAEVTEACLGQGYSARGCLVMCAVGHGRGQAWHQDCPPKDSTNFNCNRLFYPHDVTSDDGSIVVVPGSHRRGLIPEGGHQAAIEGEVALAPTAGTLILLHGHVYHRVTPNVSGRPRFSVNYRAYPQSVSPDVCSVGVYRSGAVDFRTGNRVDRGTLA